MRKLLGVILAGLICCSLFSFGKVEAATKEAFDIDYHNIDVVVNEDGTLDVVETMKVTFTQKRHGIYVNIPKSYTMNWDMDGTIVLKHYQFPVTKVDVLSDHDWDKEGYDHYVQVKIGNADYYANTTETYKWKYRIVTRDLDLDGLQMVFLNLITNGWNTDTASCQFTIQMPKDFDANQISVSYPGGVLNGQGSENGLTVSVSGNKITGKYENVISSKDALTIRVILEENYFTFPNLDSYGLAGVVCGSAFIFILTLVFLKWGKDDPVIVAPEYHSPVDLDSAQVGIIINEFANDRDLISLLLDWGRRGIITIQETEDDLVLEAINGLEPDAKEYERIMYDKLFEKGNKVEISSLNEKFYTTLNNAKKQLTDYYSTEKRRLSTVESESIQFVMFVLCGLPVIFMGALVYYHYYFDLGWLIFAVATEITYVFVSAISSYLVDNVYVLKPITRGLIFFAVSFGFICPLVYLGYLISHTGVNGMYLITIVLIELATIIETAFMKKRTLYGNQMLGRVLGLREFIKDADLDRLQQLQSDNPYYFYDILPYAYALGMVDIWNEQFKKIKVEPCSWYLYNNNDYYMYDHYHRMHSMDSHMSVIQSKMTSVPASEASGGSSGGGGGFSGGGFGGSSGGSW